MVGGISMSIISIMATPRHQRLAPYFCIQLLFLKKHKIHFAPQYTIMINASTWEYRCMKSDNTEELVLGGYFSDYVYTAIRTKNLLSRWV